MRLVAQKSLAVSLFYLNPNGLIKVIKFSHRTISIYVSTKRVELGDVTLVLPRREAVHATGGGRSSEFTAVLSFSLFAFRLCFVLFGVLI